MDVQPTEESSSIVPNRRRNKAESLPSLELLNDLMEYPREMADFFNDAINDADPDTTQRTTQTISTELGNYKKHWLDRHLSAVQEEYRSIVTASPETAPEKNELSFHVINQFIMPQWHRVLVSPKSPKMDTMDLETAQIRLAIESTALLPTQNSFEQTNLRDSELRDIDAMIKLLQLSIDGELHNQPNIIAVPHPQMGSNRQQADFLIFEPMPDDSFNKVEVKSSDILDPTRTPGYEAIELLNRLRISSVMRRPEFQDKAVFHKLILAHRKARIYTQEA